MARAVRASVQKIAYRIGEFVHRLRNGIAVSNARYERQLDLVNAAGLTHATLSDEQLQQTARSIHDRVRVGLASADEVFVESFSIAREAAARHLGLRPYDVQIIAALDLQSTITPREACSTN